MDFHFSDDQNALRQLASKIISDFSQPARLRAMDESDDAFDGDLWMSLASAGVLGAGLAEPVGAGLGVTGTCVLLEEIGRHVTALPVWSSVCVTATTIEKFGSAALRARLVADLGTGAVIGAAALEESLLFDPLHPNTSIRRQGDGWSISGEKVAVPYGPVADVFLVPARHPDGQTCLCAVSRDGPGVEIVPGRATTGAPVGTLVLDAVPIASEEVLGGESGDAAAYAYQIGLAGLCATAAGVLDGGLRITADYIAQRQQFGRPIATFQGAAMRIADAFIDAQAVWVAAWSAIWRLQTGRPAEDALAIAKFWAADGGQRAVHAFQHLHGGMGMDVTYPIHRYFTWAKSLEVALGGATVQLERLGASLAKEP